MATELITYLRTTDYDIPLDGEIKRVEAKGTKLISEPHVFVCKFTGANGFTYKEW